MKQREWSAGYYTRSAPAFERDIYPEIIAKTIEDIHTSVMYLKPPPAFSSI